MSIAPHQKCSSDAAQRHTGLFLHRKHRSGAAPHEQVEHCSWDAHLYAAGLHEASAATVTVTCGSSSCIVAT